MRRCAGKEINDVGDMSIMNKYSEYLKKEVKLSKKG